MINLIKILNEQQLHLSGHQWQGDIGKFLYHFTTIMSLEGILKADKMYAGKSTDKSNDYEGHKYVSFTNTLNFNRRNILGFSNYRKACCLVFEYSKLKNLPHAKWIFNKKTSNEKENEIRIFDDIVNVKKLLYMVIFYKNKIHHLFEEDVESIKKTLKTEKIKYQVR